MIKIYTKEKEEIQYKSLIFNGGEVHTNLHTLKVIDDVTIEAKIKSSDSLMTVLQLNQILREVYSCSIVNLKMLYCPYARQDRHCAKGDSFSLKVFCDIINAQGFNKVTIADPHSDVTPALLKNVEVIEQIDIISKSKILTDLCTNTELVSPDAGSNKKVQKISEYCARPFIRADKVRCVLTGNIKETIVYCKDLGGKEVTIFDDICDGGRTFIELAKSLKNQSAGKINLYVTHGIFSNGIDYLVDNGINHIFTTDSLPQNQHRNLTVIKL